MQGYITSIFGLLQIMSLIKAGQDQKWILTCTENDWPSNWYYKAGTITSTEFCILDRGTDCDIQLSYIAASQLAIYLSVTWILS